MSKTLQRMNTPPREVQPTKGPEAEDISAQDAPYEVLTPERAQSLRATWVGWSPWALWRAQAGVGLLCVLLAAWTPWPGAGVSALWGAVSVVLPSAGMAWGVTRPRPPHAGAALMAMAFWESLKVGATLVLMGLAIGLQAGLNWSAFLITTVVCVKFNGWALLWWSRRSRGKNY